MNLTLVRIVSEVNLGVMLPSHAAMHYQRTCRIRYCIHSDVWRGYDGLVDIAFDKHLRVHHGESAFANGDSQINGIESFWSNAKRRMAKFNGIYLSIRFICTLKRLSIDLIIVITFTLGYLNFLRNKPL